MNVISKFKNLIRNDESPSVPAAASYATRRDTVYAPISGMLMKLSEINDDTISGGLMGQGYGILPVGNIIYAPVSGRITVTTVTNHAIGLIAETGAEILIHVGLGTVNMDGKGFTRFVETGDQVSAGQPLLSFDSEVISAAGYDDVVTCIVSNPQLLSDVELIGSSNTLLGGRPLVKLGDPLFVAK